MDENSALMGEWVPPSPTSKAFFSSYFGRDEPISSQISDEARNGSSSFGSYQGTGTEDVKLVGVSCENDVTLNHLPDVKRRGGLGDRIAARAGFNAPWLNTESIRSSDRSSNDEVKSPYITIPPGISPTAMLESPVFLSNFVTQASPTTGKFPLFPDGNLRGTTMVSSGQSKEDFFDDVDGSSFAFKRQPEPSFPFSLGTSMGQVMNTGTFPNIDVTIRSENTHKNFIPSQVQSHSELPQSLKGKDEIERIVGTETRCLDTISGTAEHSPPLSDQQDDEEEQRDADDLVAGGNVGGVEDDGYNWRKYGQKQVKGSEFPRSYFKCTHMTCPVKKKVERSREGHLTEIIYTGEHNHPKPILNHRQSTGFNQFDDARGLEHGGDNRPSVWGAGQNGHPQWRNDSFENNNSQMSMNPELRNYSPQLQIQNGAGVESGEAVDPSSTFSNDEEDVSATVGSASFANGLEGDESESKRRKIETYAAEIGSGATRAIREPRVVVQTASDVDILDDGYRWRKYGQKVVKGNPNPRSYYKCTSVGCTVRKHVERASHDLKSVITTYEGKHNHDVPPARNSSHVNSSTSAAFASQPQNLIQRPEPSQVTNMARYERAPHLNSYSMPMMQQLPFIPPLPMGMNQASLTNFSMGGLAPRQNWYPGMPVHPYLMQQQQQQMQRQATDMGLVMPKADSKLEPNSDPNLYLSNGTSVYHQIMNKLPLGP